jgi:hypothetical protein
MAAGLHNHGWTVIGSVLVAGGSTLAGLYAFEGRLPVVMLGFLVFIAGYRVSQVGVHADGSALDPAVLDVDRPSLPRVGLLVVGWVGIAYGVVMFSQTVLQPSLSNAVLSGIASIGGYMAAHVGINGTGLGDSVFGPVLDRLSSGPGGEGEA